MTHFVYAIPLLAGWGSLGFLAIRQLMRKKHDLDYYRKIADSIRIPNISFLVYEESQRKVKKGKLGKLKSKTYLAVALNDCWDRVLWQKHKEFRGMAVQNVTSFSLKMGEKLFVKLIYVQCGQLICHELSENFLYRNVRIFDPHCAKDRSLCRCPSIYYYNNNRNDFCETKTDAS